MEYKKYIEQQKTHNNTKYRTVNRKNSRSRDIDILKREIPEVKNILCLGARDKSEVLHFRKEGYTAIGIDLYSDDESIISILDMHLIGTYYPKNSFDLVYASHSLEHAFNIADILSGIEKISKYGFYALLPFDTNKTYKHPSACSFMKKGVSEIDIENEYVKYIAGKISFLEERSDEFAFLFRSDM